MLWTMLLAQVLTCSTPCTVTVAPILTPPLPIVQPAPEPEPAPAPVPAQPTYRHLLAANGLQPAFVNALGYRWSSATPSEVRTGMAHSCQVDDALRAMRFELRETPNDYSSDGRRRSELSLVETDAQLIHNSQRVWNSFLFRMQPFTDPAGMKAVMGTTAFSINQLKPNSGGNPTRAMRLTGSAQFQATRTAGATVNAKLYTSPLGPRYDDAQPHRIVEAIMPHPTTGRWEMWLDGTKVVDFTGPIGANTDGYSLAFGLYSGGLKGTLVIEYSDIRILSAAPLDGLINNRTWP